MEDVVVCWIDFSMFDRRIRIEMNNQYDERQIKIFFFFHLFEQRI